MTPKPIAVPAHVPPEVRALAERGFVEFANGRVLVSCRHMPRAAWRQFLASFILVGALTEVALILGAQHIDLDRQTWAFRFGIYGLVLLAFGLVFSPCVTEFSPNREKTLRWKWVIGVWKIPMASLAMDSWPTLLVQPVAASWLGRILGSMGAAKLRMTRHGQSRSFLICKGTESEMAALASWLCVYDPRLCLRRQR